MLGRQWPKASPALWEITGPGGQHGWLFGTVHSLPSDMKWRTAKIDDALARSSLLVVEIADLSDADAAKSAFDRLSTTPGQLPITRRVPAADRASVMALLKEAGLRDDAFRNTETWAAAIILAGRVSHDDPAYGVDRKLLATRKRVEGLETFEQQYGIFDRLSQEDQTDLLVATAREAAANVHDDEAVAWLVGNMPALEHEASVGILADAGLRQALQLDRNLAWDDRIRQILANGEKPFVAVGAAHMLGPEGLPALLAAHGYKVRRIQ
jgi:uncharacterized protein YbaP (TraB family)